MPPMLIIATRWGWQSTGHALKGEEASSETAHGNLHGTPNYSGNRCTPPPLSRLIFNLLALKCTILITVSVKAGAPGSGYHQSSLTARLAGSSACAPRLLRKYALMARIASSECSRVVKLSTHGHAHANILMHGTATSRACAALDHFRRLCIVVRVVALLLLSSRPPFFWPGKSERSWNWTFRTAMAAQKPLLSPSNKEARLRFTMGHALWTADIWGRLVFADESSTFSTRQDQLVRRPCGARRANYPVYVQRVASSGRTSVNVWGAISKHGLDPLHRIVGRLTSTRYCDEVDTVLVPFVQSGLFSGVNFLFQRDLAPIQTARIAKDHLRQYGIEELPWVPKGVDHNIIESVRSRMKAAMVRIPIYSITEDHLWDAVQAEWECLKGDTSFVSSLYDSLLSRMVAVNGARTRY
ncbi:hypothetical protein HPB47_014895 [Ixodes persulcatus]|uniref:Uncharacterized protein n=1 Tax=Ixodes persulcatus TaxID=34615 RepID=A0AC60R0J8_IXOPE|nr:hypothetical protein HPB47_014895 [Ixodes persulcatus]